MALPTIAHVFRCTLKWGANEGVQPVNVLNIFCNTSDVSDVGAGIDAGIAAMADPSHLFHCCSDDQECSTVGILPLDGTSATTDYTLATAITGGSGAGQTIPQACALIKLQTALRGPQHRGRVYAGPISEASAVGGFLLESSLEVMQPAWDAFVNGMGDAAPSCVLGVASYVHSHFQSLTNVSVESVLGTQRRRQNQLR